MSFTHKILKRWSGDARSLEAENSYSGDGQVSRSVDVPDETTDMLVNIALDVDQIKAIFIKSTKDVTLETNDGSDPDNTIALVANEPYVWHTDSYFANLLTEDVTAIYLTNASGAAAVVSIEAVYDSTP